MKNKNHCKLAVSTDNRKPPEAIIPPVPADIHFGGLDLL
jgi:hypothetical protein